ncbi:MAG: lipid A-modifier LpxR family protein [Pseudomonadota bacterium]
MRHFLFVPLIGGFILAAQPIAAQQQTLGFGRLLNNDALGDQSDRWRTAGYTVSWVRGTAWDGELPDRPGDILEFRFSATIISPEDLTDPGAGERLYAGTLSAGIHTHFDWRGFDVSAGAGVAVLGEQTGLRGLQTDFHDQFGLPRIDINDTQQVDDQVRAHATVEIGRDIAVGGVELRPYVELQAGIETLARAGMDLTIGRIGETGLMLRDVTTGQRYVAIDSARPTGYSAVLGADFTYIADSFYLPSSGPVEAEETRFRLRGGLEADLGLGSTFFGVTYLSEEYVGQSEGQVVGSLNIRLDF